MQWILVALALVGCAHDRHDPTAPAPASDAPSTMAFLGDCRATAWTGVPGGPALVATSDVVSDGTIVSGNVQPAHCVVTGRLGARTGADGKPYATGFELRLPLAWNGRFVFQGGGGNDGAVRPALGSLAGGGALAGMQTGALAQGYAVVSTDAGHQGTDASFGLDPEARVDHAWRSYVQVNDVAHALMRQAYGRDAHHAYFVGCSGGGRQGLLFAQRFPDAFDGIAANAPAIRVAREAAVAAVWNLQTWRAIAPTDADGRPIISQALSASDMTLLGNAISKTCDALDGAADGIVAVNPSSCRFDPATLQCRGDETDACLSAAQVDAVRRNFAGPVDRAGRPVYASWPWDPGVAGANWREWRLGRSATSIGDSRDETLIAADAMRLEFFTPPDPTFDYWSFDVDRDMPRMDAYAATYHTTTTDLARFKARGGRLLLIHGTADPIFSANDTIAHHDQLVATHGGPDATRAFARLFLVPGMNHCANTGGPTTDLYDSLAPLVDWVERGTAPERIEARAGAATPWPGRTRPLCPYPAIARYVGSGSLEQAANFRCEPVVP